MAHADAEAHLEFEDVLRTAQSITSTTVAEHAEVVDRDGRWPEESVRELTSRLGGLVIPKEMGGLGFGLSALAQVCETVAQQCSSSALCFGMHSVAAAVAAAKPTDEQRERFVEPIAAGTHITTLALSEPGTGSHFWLPQTKLAANGSGYVVSGEKTFVTNGGHADSYVVSTVAADPDAPPGRFSCVLVPGDAPGVEWGGPWTGLGMRGNSSRSVELRDVAISGSHILGAEGDQIWYVFNVVAPYFLVAMAGTYLGIAQAAFDEATGHLTQRKLTHLGVTLSKEPVLQHRVGTLYAELEKTRRLIYYACDEAERGGPAALPALCAAKADVAAMAVGLVNEAMTLVGGKGYRNGAAMERRMRDARAAHVMSPTTDILLTWVGRAILGENILSG